ncbi:MAG TPA: GNAT family N-acetyltransferase [Thermomicrobiales bacterium]|nr:GNAT family N-acetyltransferase [Thermomicrobiales bacterium]
MTASAMIRTASTGDIPAIRRVAQVTWRATYADQIAAEDIEQFLASAYSLPSLTTRLARFGDGFIVAALDRKVIGYAMAGLNRDGEPELYAIYVLPEHHGVGAGHLLWNAAKDVLVRQGYARMCCWVMSGNVGARRFYERQGAIMTEEREFPVGATMVREARYCAAIRD